jgi:hypothetical protein
MTRLRRVGWSLLSALLSESIAGLVLCLPGRHWEELFGFFYFATFLMVPGWILSLPLVLTIDRLRGWRIWLAGIAGSCIGPIVLLSVAVYARVGGPGNSHGTYDSSALTLLYVATAISILSTALYIFFIKLSTRDSIKPPTEAHL